MAKSKSNAAADSKNEFFEALNYMEKEKGISSAYLIEKIRTAISLAIKKDIYGSEDSIVDIDPEKKVFYVAMRKTVVDEVTNPMTEIALSDTVKYTKEHSAKPIIGNTFEIELDPQKFGRIAAKTAKEVITQGIRTAEKDIIYKYYLEKEHDVISATVLKTDPVRGGITLDIGKMVVVLPKNEQVPGDSFEDGKIIKVYIVEVLQTEKGPRVVISRTHPGLVKRLFEKEVPEIYEGKVEITNISREAGSRSKIAVTSEDADIDAVGACIGQKGKRVATVVDELGGEKIDVVRYSDDPKEFISAALSPANVISVKITDEQAKSCSVTVPDHQLSLAIGNKGQNARLAARLTGWKIDIRPESGFYGEESSEPVHTENTDENVSEE